MKIGNKSIFFNFIFFIVLIVLPLRSYAQGILGNCLGSEDECAAIGVCSTGINTGVNNLTTIIQDPTVSNLTALQNKITQMGFEIVNNLTDFSSQLTIVFEKTAKAARRNSQTGMEDERVLRMAQVTEEAAEEYAPSLMLCRAATLAQQLQITELVANFGKKAYAGHTKLRRELINLMGVTAFMQMDAAKDIKKFGPKYLNEHGQQLVPDNLIPEADGADMRIGELVTNPDWDALTEPWMVDAFVSGLDKVCTTPFTSPKAYELQTAAGMEREYEYRRLSAAMSIAEDVCGNLFRERFVPLPLTVTDRKGLDAMNDLREKIGKPKFVSFINRMDPQKRGQTAEYNPSLRQVERLIYYDYPYSSYYLSQLAGMGESELLREKNKIDAQGIYLDMHLKEEADKTNILAAALNSLGIEEQSISPHTSTAVPIYDTNKK